METTYAFALATSLKTDALRSSVLFFTRSTFIQFYLDNVEFANVLSYMVTLPKFVPLGFILYSENMSIFNTRVVVRFPDDSTWLVIVSDSL